MKQVLKSTLKVMTTLVVGYVSFIAIMTAISPVLIPNDEEDNDFDDFDLDDDFNILDDEMDENDLGCECADDVML